MKIKNIETLQVICEEKDFDLVAKLDEINDAICRNGESMYSDCWHNINGVDFTVCKKSELDDDGNVISDFEVEFRK